MSLNDYSITRCSIEELDYAARFAYERNGVDHLRCRPFEQNESFESIRASFEKYVQSNHGDVLLQVHSNSLVGVTCVEWIEKDKYLALTHGVFFAGQCSRVLDNYLEHLKLEFPNYHLYANVINEHNQLIEYYKNNGFNMLEDAVLYELSEFSGSVYSSKVERLNNENSEAIYTKLSCMMTEDTYWNIERLSSNLDKFIILGYYDEIMQGALYAQIYKNNMVEVFGIVADNETVIRALLDSLAFCCESINALKLILYTDNRNEIQESINLGFSYLGSNKCFVKTMG